MGLKLVVQFELDPRVWSETCKTINFLISNQQHKIDIYLSTFIWLIFNHSNQKFQKNAL